jgi:hypothetical protein
VKNKPSDLAKLLIAQSEVIIDSLEEFGFKRMGEMKKSSLSVEFFCTGYDYCFQFSMSWAKFELLSVIPATLTDDGKLALRTDTAINNTMPEFLKTKLDESFKLITQRLGKLKK